MRRFACCLLAAVVSASACLPCGAQTSSSQIDYLQRDKQVQEAIDKGCKWLLNNLRDNGHLMEGLEDSNEKHGGWTALTLYAILTGGVSKSNPKVRACLKFLAEEKLTGVYAHAMRASAYAAAKDPNVQALLASDIEWLMSAASIEGAYTYTSLQGSTHGGRYDNSNSQMAVLGVWAGARRGVTVPGWYWKRIRGHWQAEQQSDGGWSYQSTRGGPSYGSMTAAGLATYYICLDAQAMQDDSSDGGSDPQELEAGLKWLGDNFSVSDNPQKHDYYYYWMYSLERVGLASGMKRFGGHDWYEEGTSALLERQRPDGSWAEPDKYGLADTAFAILFLARGRSPILINKLAHPGRWNSRPRDTANFTAWVSDNTEQSVSWQVVKADDDIRDWHDAPILYISGSGPIEFTEEQVNKLRRYVFQGGLIVSEAARSNGDFTMDMQKLYKQLFPQYNLRAIEPDHPLLASHFSLKDPLGALAISNGARVLAVHFPQDISAALQRGANEQNLPHFKLMTNLYVLASDKGVLLPRGVPIWPTLQPMPTQRTIKVTRVSYEGNWDPEPLALERLGIVMNNEHQLRLEVSSTPASQLDASVCKIAFVTGTSALTFSQQELAVMREFLKAGGTLIIDSANGSKEFTESVERQILTLLEGQKTSLLSLASLQRGPAKLDKIQYRRDFAMTLGLARNQLRMKVVRQGQRPAIIFSPFDLSTALAGSRSAAIRGYAPSTATNLMINLLSDISGSSDAATTSPQSQPQRIDTP